VLAKRGNPANPPHIILLPELPFEEEKFLAKVKETVEAYKYCIVVVGEGIKKHLGPGSRRGQDPVGFVWPPGARWGGGGA